MIYGSNPHIVGSNPHCPHWHWGNIFFVIKLHFQSTHAHTSDSSVQDHGLEFSNLRPLHFSRFLKRINLLGDYPRVFKPGLLESPQKKIADFPS